MEIYTQQEKLRNTISTYKKSVKSIGFVPTMGALHEGHLSLIYKSLSENDVTVVSIFVNPTQFNNTEDLDKYPRTLEADVEKIKKVSEEVILYAPSVEDVYDKDVVSEKFNFEGLDKVMEGKFRPGHFDGVGTVVKKLFQIVTPNKAYFGEKDYQQFLIIKKMVAQTKLPVDVIGCPIVRDERGLALSSRNQRLSEDRREEAAYIYQVLQEVRNQFSTKNPIEIEKWVKQQFETKKDFELEYFSIAEADTLIEIIEKESGKKYRSFVVVYVDGIRLIDNLEM
ncbi:pantoate--beta-alanine ligase [Capnocytophaga cynodegmi]|uniref:Pantothenate synthetase n=1 Tax=Capnocytophaga cynodegmi TaxID=28189 RepID=A0A250EBF8_9FLAO|nr:pantoate--beta-alanine ligase [Capnocytophaga cynodegmi]ATA69068.1 pantoate--beta-alanine ligase [Capnocytophaga cynodegmi]